MPTNTVDGVRWLKRSAEDGWPKSEFSLATYYFNGTYPFQKDIAEALKWLSLAAAHDHAEAQYILAYRLFNGIDAPKNSDGAIRLWRRAAELGYAKAQGDLGYAIETGYAETSDLAEACMWHKLAADQGIARAKVNLAKLIPRLSSKQYQEAMRRVDLFRPQSTPRLDPVMPSPEGLLTPSN